MAVSAAGLKGRTRPGRLSALDRYVLHEEAALLSAGGGAWVVDLGVGDQPWTTTELHQALTAEHPHLRVLGVEHDEHRVREAKRHQTAGLQFRAGGFDLPLMPGEPARLIRAMNVARNYGAQASAEIHRRLCRRLTPGGLLIEGTSDLDGDVLTAHLVRATQAGPRAEGLLFHTTFRRGFAPLLFRDQLPVDLRRSVRPGTPIHSLLSQWTSAWEEARRSGPRDPASSFRASVRRLSAARPDVDDAPWLIENGYLRWRSAMPRA